MLMTADNSLLSHPPLILRYDWSARKMDSAAPVRVYPIILDTVYAAAAEIPAQ